MLTSFYTPETLKLLKIQEELRLSKLQKTCQQSQQPQSNSDLQDPSNLANFLNSSGSDFMNHFSNKYSNKNIIDQGNIIEHAMIASIKEITKDFKVKLITLPSKIQSESFKDPKRIWKITKLVNGNTIDKTCDSLLTFCSKISMSHLLLQVLLTPPICNMNYVRHLSESKVAPISKTPLINNLNPSQNSALKIATTQLLTLIQGPPGTGKTTTAVEIVLEWVRQSPTPILACADSNIAVDLLHSEFLKAGLRSLRIGPGNDERNELIQDFRYQNYTQYYMQGKFQNAATIKFGMMKRKISDAQVICATCVGSTSDYLKSMTFTRVIIDEATQATEMASLIPLIRNCQQLVLIGDHKQLPPTVLSVFAQSKGMTISLFERLVKQGVKPIMLTVQYRMHPSIAAFPSHQFYNNMLENGVAEQHRPVIYGFYWPNENVRVAIVATKGIEQIYSSSVQNPK